ncbi:unnamed protein product [Dovyalis caffra]|uniref:Uncharacterized protein n=1 Tax=Dovyalis caffra TaxID=77055 RepID=A0AAV1S3P4_9ROSI|nr:unnamed protein product [Dovyalis caffra]
MKIPEPMVVVAVPLWNWKLLHRSLVEDEVGEIRPPSSQHFFPFLLECEFASVRSMNYKLEKAHEVCRFTYSTKKGPDFTSLPSR